MKINAAVLRKTGAEISVEELELDSPRTAEVLVELKASGICHSDYHVVTGDAGHELPVVLGHEGAGIIKEIGEGCLLYTSPSPRDRQKSRMPSSA